MVAVDADALHEALGLVDAVVIEADTIDRDVLEVLSMTRRVSPGLPLALIGMGDGDLVGRLPSWSAPDLVLPSTVPVDEARRALSALCAL